MKRNLVRLARPISRFTILLSLTTLLLANPLAAVMAQSPLKIAYKASRNLALFAGSYYAFDIIFYQGEKTKETIGWARQKLQGSPHNSNKNSLLADEKIDKQMLQRQKPATLFELVGQTFRNTPHKKTRD